MLLRSVAYRKIAIVISGADAVAAFAPIHCPGKAGPVRLECLGLSSDTPFNPRALGRRSGSRERGRGASRCAGGEQDGLAERGSWAVGWPWVARRSPAVAGLRDRPPRRHTAGLKPTVLTDCRDSEVAADDASPPVLGAVVAVLASLLFAVVTELQRFIAHNPTLVHHAKTLARLCISSITWLFFESLRAVRTSELVKQGHIQLRAKRNFEAGSVAAGTRPITSSAVWRPRPVSPQSWSTRPVPILPRHATVNVPATLHMHSFAMSSKADGEFSLKTSSKKVSSSKKTSKTAAMMLQKKKEEWSYLSAPSSTLQEEMAASDRRMTRQQKCVPDHKERV